MRKRVFVSVILLALGSLLLLDIIQTRTFALSPLTIYPTFYTQPDSAAPYYVDYVRHIGTYTTAWGWGSGPHLLEVRDTLYLRPDSATFARFLYWRGGNSASETTQVNTPQWSVSPPDNTHPWYKAYFTYLEATRHIIGTNSSGRSINIDDSTYTTTVAKYFIKGTLHTLNTQATQANSDSSYLYFFNHWIVGATESTNTAITISADSSFNCTAIFDSIALYTHTITTTLRNFQVVVDGSPVNTPITFRWRSGSSHTLSAQDSIISEDGRIIFRFVCWTTSLNDTFWNRNITVAPAQIVDYQAVYYSDYIGGLPNIIEYEFATTDVPTPRLVAFEFMQRVYEVTIRTFGADRPYWVDYQGPFYGTNRFLWDRGTTHRLEAQSFVPCEDSTDCFIRFLYWVRGGRDTVTTPVWLTYVSETTYIDAHFEVVPTYHYVINTSPDGRRFYVDGVAYSSPVDRYWWSGSNHTISTDSVQVNGPDSLFIYYFIGWKIGNDTIRTARTTITSSGNYTVTALFVTIPFYRHTITTRPRVRPVYVDGNIFMPPRTYTWERGTSHIIGTDSIQVAADSSEYYYFVGWELSEGGSAIDTLHTREISVSPTSAIDYTGIFVVWPYYRHTISTSPAVLPVRVDGVEITPPVTYRWLDTTAHVLETDTLMVGSDGRFLYHFLYWVSSLGETLRSDSVVVSPTGEVNYTAYYWAEFWGAGPALAEFEFGTDIELPRLAEFEFGTDLVMPRLAVFEFTTDIALPRLVVFEFSPLTPTYVVMITLSPDSITSYYVDGAGPFYTTTIYRWIPGTSHTVTLSDTIVFNTWRWFYRFYNWTSDRGDSFRSPRLSILMPSYNITFTGNFNLYPVVKLRHGKWFAPDGSYRGFDLPLR